MKHLGLALILISISACSAFERRADPNDKTLEAPLADADKSEAEVTLRPAEPNEIDDSKPLTDGIASPIAETVNDTPTVDVTETKKSYLDQKYHEPKTDIIPANEERKETSYNGRTDGVDPNKSLGWLKNGNTRFVKGSLRADGQSKKDIKRLIQKEKPHAIVFSSSDSRIPPEVIFDQKLGEIYVIRNLGLTVDNSTLNGIDYAVGDLGTRLIIVLDRSYPGQKIDFSHADQSAQKLVDKSAVVKSALDAKNIQIVPAVYDIESGKVHFGK